MCAAQEVATLNAERDDILMALEEGGSLGGAAAAAAGLGGRPHAMSAHGRPMSAMGRPMSAVSARGGPAGSSGAAAGGADSQIQIKIQRYEDVIESLKKLLEGERRRTKQVRVWPGWSRLRASLGPPAPRAGHYTGSRGVEGML